MELVSKNCGRLSGTEITLGPFHGHPSLNRIQWWKLKPFSKCEKLQLLPEDRTWRGQDMMRIGHDEDRTWWGQDMMEDRTWSRTGHDRGARTWWGQDMMRTGHDRGQDMMSNRNMTEDRTWWGQDMMRTGHDMSSRIKQKDAAASWGQDMTRTGHDEDRTWWGQDMMRTRTGHDEGWGQDMTRTGHDEDRTGHDEDRTWWG